MYIQTSYNLDFDTVTAWIIRKSKRIEHIFCYLNINTDDCGFFFLHNNIIIIGTGDQIFFVHIFIFL